MTLQDVMNSKPQQHSITSQKTSIFSDTHVRNSKLHNFTQPRIIAHRLSQLQTLTLFTFRLIQQYLLINRSQSQHFILRFLIQCDVLDIQEFIHSAVCLTTGPKPLPKRALHIVRSRASSFK